MDKEEAQDLSWTYFVMLVAPKVLLDYLRPMITKRLSKTIYRPKMIV